jgi:hypothetical protein
MVIVSVFLLTLIPFLPILQISTWRLRRRIADWAKTIFSSMGAIWIKRLETLVFLTASQSQSNLIFFSTLVSSLLLFQDSFMV